MTDDAERLAHVAGAIGHQFSDLALLRDALTHRSLKNERPKLAPHDNERLELLGDAVLGLIAAMLLYERFPDAREGELTRRRADLVCEATLADIAREIDLGPALRLGRGEEASGGRDKPRLLASAVEALFGAVFLDGGHQEATRIGRALLGPRLDSEAPGASDFKSRVQEILQSRGVTPPAYEVVRTEGPDHDRIFFVQMRVGDDVVGEGSGRSKTEAEQAAAQAALPALERAETPA
jgi:ribonuclease-3